MTKSSTRNKGRRGRPANGSTEMPAPMQEADQPQAEGEQQEVQLTEEQQYLSDLFKKAQEGKVPADQKVMVDMLAQSEAAIVKASKEANTVERQIYDLQVKQQQLRDGINNERGKARGLAEALLAMRDQKPASKTKRAKRSSGASATPSLQ